MKRCQNINLLRYSENTSLRDFSFGLAIVVLASRCTIPESNDVKIFKPCTSYKTLSDHQVKHSKSCQATIPHHN